MAVFVILFDNIMFGYYLSTKHLFISLFPYECLFTCFMIIRQEKVRKKKRSLVLNGLLFY